MESASERAIREGKKRDVESDKRAIRAWFATGLNVLPSSFENFNFIRYVRHKTLFSTKPCLEVLRIATLHFTLVSTEYPVAFKGHLSCHGMAGIRCN